MENLFNEFVDYTHKNKVLVNVMQGVDENEIWVDGLESDMIYGCDLSEIYNFVKENQLHWFMDCSEGHITIYTK